MYLVDAFTVFHPYQLSSMLVYKKCSYVIYVNATALTLLFLPTCVHYGRMLSVMSTGCLPVLVAVITICQPWRWIDSPTAVSAHMLAHVRAHTQTHTHTGLIVPAVAPLPHYLYNCMSETFSSAAKPSLHNGDKHPSHDNSPLGHWFG